MNRADLLWMKEIIMGMDDDDGVSEQLYDGICGMIYKMLGSQAVDIFTSSCNCADGRFWLRGHVDYDELWEEMSSEMLEGE